LGKINIKLLRDEYYAIRGLMPNGIVSEEKLPELGLPELRDKRYKK
jgi:aldehyde:ferredoxin oxidoreductase